MHLITPFSGLTLLLPFAVGHLNDDCSGIGGNVFGHLRNDCGKFALTADTGTYEVFLPKTAHPGPATLGPMFDGKKRDASPTRAQANNITREEELEEEGDGYSSSEYDEPCPTGWWPSNDKTGPGINNIAMKKIKGIGSDGKTVVTYPNKDGNPDCKTAKGCVALNTIPIRSCLEYLQEKIYKIACHERDMSFMPRQPIVCAPSRDADYCAYVEYIPWVPVNAKAASEFAKMNTQPYKNNTEEGTVPILAIKEGIDWIIQGGAKMCGHALLPVPATGVDIDGQTTGQEGFVYILTVDIDRKLDRSHYN